MGLFMQLLGVVCVVISLIISIVAIAKGNSSNLTVIFLMVGLLLIGVGRKLK